MTPIKAKTFVQLTKQGLVELKTELNELSTVKLPTIIDRVAVARSHGDLKENAEYHAAKEEQRLTESRISKIQDILTRVKIVKKTTSSSKIGIGSQVTAHKKNKKKSQTFKIVGEFEANPPQGKISSSSPLGTAMMGKKPGQTVVVSSPAGKVEWVIDKVK